VSVDPRRLQWFSDGEGFALAAIERLSDDDLAGPSLLPGWRRADVVGHLARNADALGNLMRWARTGEPSPMYPSVEARAEGIEATAAQAPDALRADVVEASGRLVAAVEDLPTDGWDAEVVTGRGRRIPASDIPWMRVRETWIHTVDLDAGVGFADVPGDVVVALLEDIAGGPGAAAADPPLAVRVDDRDGVWTLGDGDPVEVSGPAAAVLTWLSGRGDGADLATTDPSGRPPAAPAWL
jgi:maleylpyruvate isomerase